MYQSQFFGHSLNVMKVINEKRCTVSDFVFDLVISPLHVLLDMQIISNQPAQHPVCYVGEWVKFPW